MNERFRKRLKKAFVKSVLGYMTTGKLDIRKLFKTPEVIPQRKLDMKVVGYSIDVGSTEITLFSAMYKDEEEFDDWVGSYRTQYKPTGLKITISTGEKDTPDGPMRTPILIWRASWPRRESENLPIVNITPSGSFYNN